MEKEPALKVGTWSRGLREIGSQFSSGYKEVKAIPLDMVNPITIGFVIAGVALLVVGAFSTQSCDGTVTSVLIGVAVVLFGIGAILYSRIAGAVLLTAGLILVAYGWVQYAPHAGCLVY